MDIALLIYIALSLGFTGFFALFGIYSIIERKSRAAIISFFIAVFLIALYSAIFFYDQGNITKMIIILASVAFLVLFFTPYGKKEALQIDFSTERFDERDTMFARDDYRPGSKEYDQYYSSHPELKKIDDKIRSKPELLEPGGKYFDEKRADYVKGLFDLEETLAKYVDGDIINKKLQISDKEATKLIKEKCSHLGASETGITTLDQRWVYSHVGRGPENWGSKIENTHRFAICFSVEMDHEKVSNAPEFDVIEETAKQYIAAQNISISLANFIREMGFPARAHVSGSNYQVILPALAYFAGLGELGRHGYLISKKHGSRIRLSAVTTDLPLIPDRRIDLGVQNFCEICRKCALNCPSKAIPGTAKQNVRGVEKWQLNIEKCFSYWKNIGTDCALCMKVCPFSHPDNLPHNIIRLGIRNSKFARKLSLWGDDFFYGKKI